MTSTADIWKETRTDELTIQLDGIFTAESALNLIGAVYDTQPERRRFCVDSENLQGVEPLGQFVLHGLLHQFADMTKRIRFKGKFSDRLHPPTLRTERTACLSGCGCTGKCVVCRCAIQATETATQAMAA